MPYVTEVPDTIDIDHLETPSPLNPLGIKGAGEAGVIPGGGGVRCRHRGRRGHPDHGDADLAVGPVHPAAAEGDDMKISGADTIEFPVATVWDALLDPQVLVSTIPGCERLEATGENAYAMTVTAGVASIRGTYSGSCTLTDLEPHESLVMNLQGSGAPGTIGADRRRALRGGRAGRHADLLRGRRRRRRHGRWRRPADADQRLQADGRRVLQQRRELDRGSAPPRPRRAEARSGAGRVHRTTTAQAPSARRTTSSRGSPSGPGSSCSALPPERCSAGRRR